MAKLGEDHERHSGYLIEAINDEQVTLGLAPDGQPVISDPAVMAAMVNAIIAQECANYAYPADVVAAGIAGSAVTG